MYSSVVLCMASSPDPHLLPVEWSGYPTMLFRELLEFVPLKTLGSVLGVSVHEPVCTSCTFHEGCHRTDGKESSLGGAGYNNGGIPI